MPSPASDGTRRPDRRAGTGREAHNPARVQVPYGVPAIANGRSRHGWRLQGGASVAALRGQGYPADCPSSRLPGDIAGPASESTVLLCRSPPVAGRHSRHAEGSVRSVLQRGALIRCEGVIHFQAQQSIGASRPGQAAQVMLAGGDEDVPADTGAIAAARQSRTACVPALALPDHAGPWRRAARRDAATLVEATARQPIAGKGKEASAAVSRIPSRIVRAGMAPCEWVEAQRVQRRDCPATEEVAAQLVGRPAVALDQRNRAAGGGDSAAAAAPAGPPPIISGARSGATRTVGTAAQRYRRVRVKTGRLLRRCQSAGMKLRAIEISPIVANEAVPAGGQGKQTEAVIREPVTMQISDVPAAGAVLFHPVDEADNVGIGQMVGELRTDDEVVQLRRLEREDVAIVPGDRTSDGVAAARAARRAHGLRSMPCSVASRPRRRLHRRILRNRSP